MVVQDMNASWLILARYDWDSPGRNYPGYPLTEDICPYPLAGIEGSEGECEKHLVKT